MMSGRLAAEFTKEGQGKKFFKEFWIYLLVSYGFNLAIFSWNKNNLYLQHKTLRMEYINKQIPSSGFII